MTLLVVELRVLVESALVPVLRPTIRVLLILPQEVEDPSRESISAMEIWLYGDVRGFHGTEYVVYNSNLFDFVIANLSTNRGRLGRFEMQNQVATLGQVQNFAKPPQTRTWHTPIEK